MIRSLKVHEWPDSHQALWQTAQRPGGRLSKGGTASHMKQVTCEDLARRYGQFLDHVWRTTGSIPTDVTATVTGAQVDTYTRELQNRVRSVTVHGSIAKLARMARLLAPSEDWGWLKEKAAELELQMRPQSKTHRIVESHRIVAAGLKLMQFAEQSPDLNAIRRAELYRNGLMIALLAICPIRLKNMASLQIDQHLLQVAGSWHLKLAAHETKEQRPDERPLPEFLNDPLEAYLSTHRPVFRHEGKALWVGRTGTALKPHAVAHNITETTRQLLGKAISPHLFRSCGASTASVYAGSTPHLASALLNHRSPKVTEEHYIRASSQTFSKKFEALVDGLGRRSSRSPSSPTKSATIPSNKPKRSENAIS